MVGSLDQKYNVGLEKILSLDQADSAKVNSSARNTDYIDQVSIRCASTHTLDALNARQRQCLS
jgi:hypothetical protein